ncbi:hypothetical protein FOPE_01697 [Fonsecaea pedrosoi]|nr:hypothetical protein FOPE_01697 [Fonsecaea pedrosoi]
MVFHKIVVGFPKFPHLGIGEEKVKLPRPFRSEARGFCLKMSEAELVRSQIREMKIESFEGGRKSSSVRSAT